MPAPVVSLIVLAAVVLLVWFVFGTQGNIRRGERFMQWLQDGLPELGSRTTVRWFGSSAVELKITEPAAPFSSAETLVVLEPRDLGWLWALSRARGRRDFLIMRARLTSSPSFELEAGDRSSYTGADRLKRLDTSAWVSTTWGSIEVAHTVGADADAVRKLWHAFEAGGAAPWRLSVRRDNPHLEVHIVPPDVEAARSRPLFEAFRELGKSVVNT
jgi:hypothetical protein